MKGHVHLVCLDFFPRLQLANDQEHFLANIIYKPTLALLGRGWGSPCASLLRRRGHQSEPERPRRPCCSLPDFSDELLGWLSQGNGRRARVRCRSCQVTACFAFLSQLPGVENQPSAPCQLQCVVQIEEALQPSVFLERAHGRFS